MGGILIVCTGNICRSPMAEGILRQVLAERGIRDVSVESSGISAWDGTHAAAEAIMALSEREIDISGHSARRTTRDMLESADLVLAMTSEHREAVERMSPAAGARTFTLKELVYLLDRHRPPDGDRPAPERIREAVELANTLRTSGPRSELMDEDVADPLGLGVHAFRASAWELGELFDRLADSLFGLGVEESSSRAGSLRGEGEPG